MKKNLFGLLAVVLAVGFSAFTSGMPTTYAYYEFRPAVAGDYTPSSVQNTQRWFYTSSGPVCNFQANEKACTIGIDVTKLSNSTASTLAAAESTIAVIPDSDPSVAAVADVEKSGLTVLPVKNNIFE